ncbi:MAG TPA: polyisoprenoid-binding protein [Nitrospirae bacterium]|nr:polyisoprenoid-binding protein [Nitrospirota bacterium]
MPKWTIDPDHSVAAFSIRHMMITNVHGQFNKVTGVIQFDPADTSGAKFELEIDVSGILTGMGKRDDHLKSADFFDIETHPKITFNSTSLGKSGDLTVHGITRPVTLDVSFSGPLKSPFGETSMGFTGRTVINREDFGMTWNEPVENGGFMVGKDVELSVDIEADLAD